MIKKIKNVLLAVRVLERVKHAHSCEIQNLSMLLDEQRHGDHSDDLKEEIRQSQNIIILLDNILKG